MKYYTDKETGLHTYYLVLAEDRDLMFFVKDNGVLTNETSIHVCYYLDSKEERALNLYEEKTVQGKNELAKLLEKKSVFSIEVSVDDCDILYAGAEFYIQSIFKEKAYKNFKNLGVENYEKKKNPLSHINTSSPTYEYLTPVTINLVKEWVEQKHKTKEIVLECMAKISDDLYEQGYFKSALETINESWDCEGKEGFSCSNSDFHHGNLSLLRAKCHIGLMQYNKALDACVYSKEKGNKEAISLESTIKKVVGFFERFA
tara:strand:+ start:80 stop:856 length:777 start_codon:yes stop_codon:yes gene_type:complete